MFKHGALLRILTSALWVGGFLLLGFFLWVVFSPSVPAPADPLDQPDYVGGSGFGAVDEVARRVDVGNVSRGLERVGVRERRVSPVNLSRVSTHYLSRINAHAERQKAVQEAADQAEQEVTPVVVSDPNGNTPGPVTSVTPFGGVVSELPEPWLTLARCESGLNPAAVNAAGPYYGLFQFLQSTWESVGGSGVPSDASVAEQLKRAQFLQARSGWGQWPSCAAGF